MEVSVPLTAVNGSEPPPVVPADPGTNNVKKINLLLERGNFKGLHHHTGIIRAMVGKTGFLCRPVHCSQQ
jgi:hypothetical protein